MAQFAIVCAVKWTHGLLAELFWLSHMALLMAAMGLLIGATLWVCTACIGILVPHTVWFVDALGTVVTGQSPMGLTQYLTQSDAWMWLATAHHFYLAPLLFVWVVAGRNWHGMALLTMTVIFLYLTLLGRMAFDAEANVNYAYGFLGAVRHPLLDRVNLLPGSAYLLVLNAVMFAVVFAPTAWCLRRLAGSHRYECADPTPLTATTDE